MFRSDSDYPFIFRKVLFYFEYKRLRLIRREVNIDDKNNLIKIGLISNLNRRGVKRKKRSGLYYYVIYCDYIIDNKPFPKDRFP